MLQTRSDGENGVCKRQDGPGSLGISRPPETLIVFSCTEKSVVQSEIDLLTEASVLHHDRWRCALFQLVIIGPLQLTYYITRHFSRLAIHVF